MEVLALWCILLLQTCCIAVNAAIVQEQSVDAQALQLNDRLLGIETLLQASLKKNAELEKRIEVLEEDNRQLKEAMEFRGREQNERDTSKSLDNVGQADKSPEMKTTNSVSKKRSDKVARIVMGGGQAVAFTARVDGRNLPNLGQGQRIAYHSVVTNVGDAYNNSTGIFLAPVSGVYVFSFMTMVEPGDNEYLELVKNGQHVQTSYAHGTGEVRYESTAMIVALEVNAGDEVWIQTVKAYTPGSGVVHGEYTVFTGYLLAAWE